MALPEPECGLVISYSYLWRNEYEAGKNEGLKNRPCAIIVVVKNDNDSRTVTVAPITHTPPIDPEVAIEIPPKVKKHLGLDGERSWIIPISMNFYGRAMIYGLYQEKLELTTMDSYHLSYSSKLSAKLLNFVRQA